MFIKLKKHVKRSYVSRLTAEEYRRYDRIEKSPQNRKLEAIIDKNRVIRDAKRKSYFNKMSSFYGKVKSERYPAEMFIDKFIEYLKGLNDPLYKFIIMTKSSQIEYAKKRIGLK